MDDARILKILNFNTKVDYGYEECTTLLDLWDEQVNKTPNSIAVEEDEKKWTFQEIDKFSTFVSQAISNSDLQDFSVENTRNPFVVLQFPPGIWIVIGTLGIFKSSSICVPISENIQIQKINFILNDLKNPLVLTSKNLWKVQEYNRTIFLEDLFEEFQTRESINGEYEKDKKPGKIAYGWYTSGTTGHPKAALIRHDGMVNYVSFVQEHSCITKKDRSLLFTTPSFDVSLTEMWPCILAGGTLVTSPLNLRYNIPSLRRWVKEKDISIVSMATAIAEIFYGGTSDPNEFGSSLRAILTGGEKLRKLAPVGTNFRITHDYGLSEATAQSTFIDLPKGGNIPDSPFIKGIENFPVGKPIPNVWIFVLDNDLNLLDIGEVGEVCVGGISIAEGYFNRPVLTSNKFVDWSCKHWNDGKQLKLFRSGDFGYWLEDGNLVITGRKDNQIKIRGQRLEIEGIEKLIFKEIPELKEIVLAVDQDEESQKSSKDAILIAFFTINPKFIEIEIEDLIETRLEKKLTRAEIPTKWIHLENVPLNENGKSDRRLLLKMLKNDKLNIIPSKTKSNEISNWTEAEKFVGRIWSSVLNVPTSNISLNSNYFQLGGTSLSLGELSDMFSSSPPFYSRLDVSQLLVSTSVASMAKLVEKEKRNPNMLRRDSSQSNKMPIIDSKKLAKFQELFYGEHFLAKLEVAGAFHFPMGSNNINAVNLKEAFQQIISRHNVLRAIFKGDEHNNPLQIIVGTSGDEISVPIVKTGSIEHEECCEKFVEPFLDHSKFPLFNGFIEENDSEKEIIFHFHVHHILIDDISLGLMEEEMRIFCDKKKLPLLKAQFSDYVLFEQDQIQNTTEEQFQEHRSDWDDYMKDFEPLKLPPFLTKNACLGQFHFPKTLCDDLRKFCVEQGTTLHTVFLAGLSMLIFHYTNQKNVYIPFTFDRRSAKNQTIKTIGLFTDFGILKNVICSKANVKEHLTNTRLNIAKAIELNKPGDFELNIKKYPNILGGWMSSSSVLGKQRCVTRDDLFEKTHIAGSSGTIFCHEEQNGNFVVILYHDPNVYTKSLLDDIFNDYSSILQKFIQKSDSSIEELSGEMKMTSNGKLFEKYGFHFEVSKNTPN